MAGQLHWPESKSPLIHRKEQAVMLCDEYKRVVYFFLDGSLSERKVLELETHLSICHDCEERMTVHRRLRNFIRKRFARLTAPEHLKIRVVQSLRVAE